MNLWLRTNRDPLDKSLLQFSLDEIPQDAQIRSATLKLYKYTEGTANAAAYRLTHDWIEGTGADEDNFRYLPNSGVTWNSYNGPDGRWTTPGGDYDQASEVAVILSSGIGWQEWDITGMAQAWHSNPAENYGVILVDKTTWNNVQFHSSEAAEVELRPQLVIEYMSSGSQQPDEMGFEIISSHVIVDPQQEFEITIRATDALDLYAYLADFEYDPQKFELIGGQLAESQDTFTLLSDIGDPDNTGKLQILATLTGNVDGVSGDAIDLVRLIFKPKLAAGTGSFIIKAGSSFSNSESQVGALPYDMEIIVSIVSGYDLNNDGVTNIGDLVLVAAAIGTSAGDSGYNVILDLDGNNIINYADLQIIAQVLLNKE